jgi:serine phosphatase RsbU (regulator of sigma subunit)
MGEHFIFFKPRDIVSGDFYYLNIKNNKIIIAAADCTGHGVPGAFMSILGISLLNQIVSTLPDDFNAGNILTLLRNEIKQALGQTGKDDEAKDGMDISLCVLNRKEQTINFAGAYNPLILIRNNEIIKYKGDKMPIGIFIKEKEGIYRSSN